MRWGEIRVACRGCVDTTYILFVTRNIVVGLVVEILSSRADLMWYPHHSSCFCTIKASKIEWLATRYACLGKSETGAITTR